MKKVTATNSIENKTKNAQRVINLSSNENVYEFSEYTYGTKWVSFGKDNDYPDYLRDLYLSSPTHQAIVDGTVNMATGEGVQVVNPVSNPLSNKWLNENFPKSTVKSLLNDLKMYGYCVAEVYSGSIVKYSEAIKYRFDQQDEFGNIEYMWYSNDWNEYTHKKNTPVKLPIYVEGSNDELSILVMTLDKKGFDYYAPVDYNGSINYISLEAEISKYHLSNIRNGLFPSFVITFIGNEFSDEQMNSIERDINKKFGGSTNAGRAIVGFAATKDDATQLTTIDQPNIDNTYTFLSKECSEKIMVGHGVTSPIIFGIRDTGGGLGNNAEELAQSFYLYYESKLKHYQNYILDMIKKVMNGNLLFAEVEFVTENPFKNNETTAKLSKHIELNELNSQDILNKIDSLKVKPSGILIGERVFDGNLNDKALYKYIKASKDNSIVNKKLEILDKQGFLFTASDIISNTTDYYFMEQTYMTKKTKNN